MIGDVPEGWWEKVDAFDQRIRDLLRAECPALLPVYAEDHNAAVKQLRESQPQQLDHGAGRPQYAQKVLDFANATRSGPMLILDGLRAAWRQFGLELH